MTNNTKFTGADVLRAARTAMREEMAKMAGRPLTPKESEKLDQVASGISVDVLKKMGVV